MNKAETPSGWHVGFNRRELAEELSRRMGWKGKTPWGHPRIMHNPLNTQQLADLLARIDRCGEAQYAVSESVKGNCNERTIQRRCAGR